MGDFLKLKDIADIIPSLLNYFVPGFIFITIRNYSLSRDSIKDTNIFIKSVVVSSIFIQFMKIVISVNNYWFSFAIILFSFFIGILYIRFNIESKILKLLKLNKTTTGDFFDDIIDSRNGPWIYAYIPSEQLIYLGKLINYEIASDGKARSIVLTSYKVFSYAEELIADYENESNRQLLLNTKDISRIEIFK